MFSLVETLKIGTIILHNYLKEGQEVGIPMGVHAGCDHNEYQEIECKISDECMHSVRSNSPLASKKSSDFHSGVLVRETSVKAAPFASSSCLILLQLEQPSNENTVILPMMAHTMSFYYMNIRVKRR